jgi:membrane-associated protein
VEGLVEDLLDAVAGLGSVGLHVAAFLLAFGECALFMDLVVPGETGMVIAGAAAAKGDYPLPTMIAAACAGAIAGDSLSYAIGRRWGMQVIHRVGPLRRRLEPRVGRARVYFEKRGGAAVFVGRWVGVVRGVVPVVAGTAGMPYRRFVAWNVLASLLWTGVVVSAGYLLGRHIEAVVSRAGLVITVLVAAVLVAWWLVRRRSGRRGETARTN